MRNLLQRYRWKELGLFIIPFMILLLGMMVVVGCLRLSGFFQHLAYGCLGRIRTPTGLLAVTILLSGLLSAFLVNSLLVRYTSLALRLARIVSRKAT